MRFPYQRYEVSASPLDGSTDLFRPEIPLHLIGESDELFAFGLLDTGADGVAIGHSIAAILGVTTDETVRWTLCGLNSQMVDAVLGHLDIEIVDGHESVTWRMPVAVAVLEDPQQENVILLGQTGFLQFFDARFLGNDRQVELVPNESFPRSAKSVH